MYTYRDCAAPMHTGLYPPDDNHGSFDRDCQGRVTEMAVIGIKTELGISYGLARKIFEEQFDRKKETYYAQVTGRNEDQMQKVQEKGLAAINERQRNMMERTDKIERENKDLKQLTIELVEDRKTQKKLDEEFAQLRQKDNSRATTQAMVHSSAQQFTNPIEFSEETNNAMAIDLFTALKRPRSSSEDENSDKGKPQKIPQQTY
jgi:hypothetical protein